jgi:AcrR family transcriptional regulator
MRTAATAIRPERRSESRAQTRRRLLAVGRRAFARKGHAATNLRDDILIPAGVSVGSFYHQFRDKTDLFLEILRQHSETFRAMMHATHTPAAAGAPIELARQSFATVFRVAEENDDLFRIMARERESHDARVRGYLRENYRQWIAGLAADYHRMGLIDANDTASAELAAEMISALTAGTILTYLDHPAEERARRRNRLLDGLVRFTLGGVPALVAGARTPAAVRLAARKEHAEHAIRNLLRASTAASVARGR